MRRVVIAAAVALALGGCMRPPKPLQGQFPPVTVADAQARPMDGTRVRWGGEIVRTTPDDDETCFEIVSQPLDGRAEPGDQDTTFGRFIACTPGFYDPAIWAEHRDMTVVGTIDGYTDGNVGGRGYRFPKVRADAVYLWPKPLPQRTVVYDPYPYWGPWGYWGPYWGPYWGGGVWMRGGHHHH